MVGAVQDYGRVGESNGGLETNGYESRAAKVKQAPRRGGEEEESVWYEEEIDDDLKLCYALNSPKTVFIMGGGEGSAAREVLRHSTVQRVVMCDIDEEVVDFCRAHLSANRAAFASDRLRLVIDDARAELEKSSEKFDVIVGDLADPVEGGPCYQLYTKDFYDRVVKPKLSDGRGVFVTQAGPAGVLTHREVFSSIYNTLKHVFKYVKAYTAHVPSFADTWGWVMASDHPFLLTAQQIDERIRERVDGELVYLSGESLISSTTLNKSVYQSLLKETHVYTEDDARFIHGHGRARRA
ncbi:unnamed protein product [Urochloa decumbens]|uniref:PABS domain-containing protein n=1 Tax=Urochloa decumbens TaxID=240449 RepID=A0ABC9CMW0_9POAL